jgi:hypothetical protein
MSDAATAEAALTEWTRITGDRDNRVRRAIAAGVTKNRIHTITGISRATIDRILKERTMTTTTQLHGYGHYTMTASVKDTVMDYVGEHADDFDIEGLTNAFRDAINAELDGSTIELHGDDFYADYPTPDDSEDRIRQAIGDADLGALAEEFDRS